MDMPRKLKAIIFDNEWVLVKNDWDRASKIASEAYGQPVLTGKNFKKALQLSCFPGGKQSNLLAEYSAGRIDGNFFWNRILQSFNVAQSQENQEKMKEAMKSLTTEIDEDAIDLVKRLKEVGDYRLLMFSNATPEITQGNRKRNGEYYNLFDRLYLSYNMKLRKPEEEAYRCLLGDQELKGKDCLFVDDKPENLQPGKKLGMQVLLHKIGEGKLSDKLGYLLENGK